MLHDNLAALEKGKVKSKGDRAFWPLLAATPVWMIWPFASILPAFAFFEADKEIGRLAVEGTFFVTGFFGLFFGYLAARAAATRGGLRAVDDAVRGKAAPLAAYGAFWLVAYWAYQAFGR